jgi:hypothetical protein
MAARISIKKSQSPDWPALEECLRGEAKSAVRVTVRFIRCSRGTLDPDNLAGSFKALQDQLRDSGLINDDDPDSIQAFYKQLRVRKPQEGTLVQIEIPEL